LKVALWIGEQDASRAGTEALAAQLEASGITCRWQVCPDRGHAFPPDFAAALPAALDFIVAE
jgi:predicted esterase